MNRPHDPRTLYGYGLRPHRVPPCRVCGGRFAVMGVDNRNRLEIRCLMCARTPQQADAAVEAEANA